jgi:hypothetical protein
MPAIQAITRWSFMLWIIFLLSLFVDCLAQIALAIFKRLFCGVNALRSVLASLRIIRSITNCNFAKYNILITYTELTPLLLEEAGWGRLFFVIFINYMVRWWRWSLKGNANKTGFLNLSKICFNPRLRNVSVLSVLQNEFRIREVFWNFFFIVLFPWRKSTKKSRLQIIYCKTTHLKMPAIQAITRWYFIFLFIFSLSLFVDCLAQMALAIFNCLFCGVNALRSVCAS